jgi:hypothetical protein
MIQKVSELLTTLETIKNDNPAIFDSLQIEISDPNFDTFCIENLYLDKNRNTLVFDIE